MASILVVSGKSKGQYHAIGDQTCVLGRDEGCDIQILDEMVSRRHAQIRFAGDPKQYVLSDLGSANGTFINGQPVTEESGLPDEATILVGESKLYFTIADYLDRDDAFAQLDIKKRGERGKSTLIQ